MASTYLDLTNEVLRELNEIPLTSANFANAIGLQKFVKHKGASLEANFPIQKVHKK